VHGDRGGAETGRQTCRFDVVRPRVRPSRLTEECGIYRDEAKQASGQAAFSAELLFLDSPLTGLIASNMRSKLQTGFLFDPLTRADLLELA